MNSINLKIKAMSTMKKCKVILLPTNEKAPIYLYKPNNKVQIANGVTLGYGDKYQHLYFLSDEEIKEGDWYSSSHETTINQASKFNLETLNKAYWAKKIIATTDSSLAMLIPDPIIGKAPVYFPTPSQDFIKVFIEEYNKGNVIKWVDVEYEEISDNKTNDFGKKQIYYQKLKVNSRNEITIRKVKNSWSREECIKQLKIIAQDAVSFPEKFVTGICFDDSLFNKWIEENL